MFYNTDYTIKTTCFVNHQNCTLSQTILKKKIERKNPPLSEPYLGFTFQKLSRATLTFRVGIKLVYLPSYFNTV